MVGYAPVTWEAGVGLVVIMAGLILYRFWPLLKPYIFGADPSSAAVAGKDTASKDESGLMLAGGEVAAQSPGGGVAGSTPVRGMHTHMAPGRKGGAAARANALAQARQALDDETAIN